MSDLDRTPARRNHRSDAPRYRADDPGARLPSYRPTTLLASGLSLTLLLMVLPMAHLGFRPTGLQLGFIVVPVIALIACWLRPNTIWLTHFVFPASHLPLLLLHPDLTSPAVYGGLDGLVGLIAILVAVVVFFGAASPTLQREAASSNDRRSRVTHPLATHPLTWRVLAVLFTVGPALALTLPALTVPDVDPLNVALALGLGPVLAIGTSLWLSRLTIVEPPLRVITATSSTPATPSTPALPALAHECRPSGMRASWSLLAAVAALTLLLYWTHGRT